MLADPVLLIVSFVLAYAAFAGVRVWRRSGAEWHDALMAASLPAACVVALGIALAGACVGLFWDWSPGRLTPSFALAYGYRLYYGPDAGPALNTIYGPVTALAYLPATLFRTPTAAVLAASLLTALFVLAPMALVHASAGARLPAAAGFLVFYLASSKITGLAFSMTQVHADAPALGLTALAAALVWRAARPDPARLAASALCTVLAVWTKQTMAPIALPLVLHVFLCGGRRALAVHVAWLAVFGAAVSAAMVGAFGARELAFNLFELPARHPWVARTPGAMLLIARDVLSPLAAPLAFLALHVAATAARPLAGSTEVPGAPGSPSLAGEPDALDAGLRPAPSLAGEDGWWSRNRWALFALLGAVLVPSAVLSKVKQGGDLNAYSAPSYFLLAGFTLFLVESRDLTARRLLAILLALLTALEAPQLSKLDLLYQIPNNPQELAYRFALRHPESVYFPMNPLSTLLAESKLYHFEPGLYDRRLGGFPVSDAHLRAHLPRNVRWLAVDPRQSQRPFTFGPRPGARVPVEELPGWDVFEWPATSPAPRSR